MNNWLLKRRFLFIVILSTLTACAKPAATASASTKNDKEINLAGMERDILYYINEYRRSLGEPALQMIEAASEQAGEHSADMAKKVTPFGHSGFNKRVNTITKQIGSVSSAAENVAYGELTAKEVVKGWLRSPGHKKNIEGNFTLTGIGVAKDKNGVLFFTQIFLLK